MDPSTYCTQIRLEERNEAAITKKLKDIETAEEEFCQIRQQKTQNASEIEGLENMMMNTFLKDNWQESEMEGVRMALSEATSTTEATDIQNGSDQPNIRTCKAKSILPTPAKFNLRQQADSEQQASVQERLAVFQGFKRAQELRYENRQARVKAFVVELAEDMDRIKDPEVLQNCGRL